MAQNNGSVARVDAVGGDFDFGNATEGEQQLYEILGRLFGSLFHDVGHGVGHCGLKHDTLGLQAGEVHTHELARLEHDSYRKIVPRREVKCKAFWMISKRGRRVAVGSKNLRGKKIEGTTAVKRLRPLSIEPQSFLGFSVQSGVKIDLSFPVGKWFLSETLWKTVHGCAKAVLGKSSAGA